jgi:hypothetical protein
MSKVYSSNFTLDQYEFLSDLFADAKPGGRPREVELWAILNAIFYVKRGRSELESSARRLSSLANCVHLLKLWDGLSKGKVRNSGVLLYSPSDG